MKRNETEFPKVLETCNVFLSAPDTPDCVLQSPLYTMRDSVSSYVPALSGAVDADVGVRVFVANKTGVPVCRTILVDVVVNSGGNGIGVKLESFVGGSTTGLGSVGAGDSTPNSSSVAVT